MSEKKKIENKKINLSSMKVAVYGCLSVFKQLFKVYFLVICYLIEIRKVYKDGKMIFYYV